MRISDWSSDVCSSDLRMEQHQLRDQLQRNRHHRETAGMRVAEHREQPFAILMRGAAPIGDVAEPVEMQRARHRDRSDERRGGEECVRTWRTRWGPEHSKQTNNQTHTNKRTRNTRRTEKR